ncbi:MAG: hypothetical protein KDB22_26795 [Planctomycetales bacterium]|nr:hypothetical protein [Planctomycetales bacterium]
MNESKIALTERLRREGRWDAATKFKDDALRDFRAKGMKRDEAADAAWEAMEKAFPPIASVASTTDIRAEEPVNTLVQGLSEIPASWPPLPANASLQVEISWVTANRLLVRDATGVDLSRALGPAPSYAALSWLETSFLFPSKFADISVKATATQDDEREMVRREKMAIEEIRSLLAEMLEDGDI